ncbi:MAG: hypothetical protein ABR559_04745, partial [Gemmatimonadota bacterium]
MKRSVLASASLLVLLCLIPAAARAQDNLRADVREAAEQRVWIRNYLRHYDQLLSIQAALGQITATDADKQLAAAGRELFEQGYHEADLIALQTQWRGVIDEFLRSLESTVATSTSWPADAPADVYQSMATRMLGYIRADLAKAYTAGTNPLPLLREATQLLAMANGNRTVPPELDYFGASAARAASAMPGIELMPMDAAVPTAPPVRTPPPMAGAGSGARGTPAPPPGTRIIPVSTVPAGVVDRSAATSTVVLRGGQVQARVQLVGQGRTDAVGRTRRLRSDGRPDTEITLQLQAPGFVIDWVEIRRQATRGGSLVRALTQAGGIWTTRTRTNVPPVGIVLNGQLLNRSNGTISGLAIDGWTTLSLYIQDEGRLERVEQPGDVVIG